MIVQGPLLSLTEAKNKELVPCVAGNHLHSMHNPRREAEAFASNHLAHLSKSSHALVLGLGFGYHIEEIARILKLKHKAYRIAVVEAIPELARLVTSYRGEMSNVEIFTARDVNDLWNDSRLGQFLLEKPVVIIHPNSFGVAKKYYETFLGRRAPQTLGEWRIPAESFAPFFTAHSAQTLSQVVGSAHGDHHGAWARAFWECKHAE